MQPVYFQRQIFFSGSREKERQYIKSLKMDIADYCMEENISSLEQLYKRYGMPYEVANEYLSTLDVDVMAKRIRCGKWIKFSVSAMLLVVFCGVLAWAVTTYKEYRSFAESQIFTIEETIY